MRTLSAEPEIQPDGSFRAALLSCQRRSFVMPILTSPQGSSDRSSVGPWGDSGRSIPVAAYGSLQWQELAMHEALHSLHEFEGKVLEFTQQGPKGDIELQKSS